MRAALVGTIVATCAAAAAAATPAVADVKAGVDAWQQGDYAKAIAEWRPLATAGDADAQFNLGQAYKLGRGVPADMPVAMEWFRKAGDQGHLRARDNYGLLLFQQGKREQAMPYIRASADRGEPRAQYILGTAMFNGDLVPKDWITAYALMTRAASSGLDQATNSLSVMDRYVQDEDRQKGLALAAEMGRAPKAPDYAAAPTALAAAAPVSPAPTRPAPVAQPRRVASAPVPKPAAPAPAPEPPAVQTSQSAPPPPRQSGEKPPWPPASPQRGETPTHWNSAQATPPPEREPPPPVRAAAPPKARPPAPVAVAAAVDKPSASGSWRIQMGAFREAPRAHALWQAATTRVAGLSGYKLFLEKGGDVTRMQAGPLRSEADAARLCGKLRSAGYDCLIKQN